jgi:hypothetical protein
VLVFTLLFIFLTAIITAVATKWARDKCLKFFRGYHVTLERTRGQTIWGRLKVFSSGVEICYDAAYIDHRGRKKRSFMIYGGELDQQMLCLLRFEGELDEYSRRERQRQVQQTFNPGPLRRAWRGVRNFVNTLRDAFNAAIGAVVGQYQRMNPASQILATQSQQFTQIGQTLLGKFAANAYEPLLEQYIGQPVILDVADPINPNHAMQQFGGYLAEYTQNFIAVFNVQHSAGEPVELTLPNIEHAEPLPPLPAPPPIGAPPIVLPPPTLSEKCFAVRVDGPRMKIQNLAAEPVLVRRLEREGFEPIIFGMLIPPNGTLDLPARDARGGKLIGELVQRVDVVAPRKYATIRHAGEVVERKGLVDEFNEHLHLDRLPLVPKLFQSDEE